MNSTPTTQSRSRLAEMRALRAAEFAAANRADLVDFIALEGVSMQLAEDTVTLRVDLSYEQTLQHLTQTMGYHSSAARRALNAFDRS